MARILVVDDTPTNRRLVISLLSYEGHELLEASDGVEGLQRAQAERPDLVISDVLMPTMDGFEFVRRLRSDPELANVAVIFYTAHYLEPESLELARRCRVARILAKPCDSAQMLAAVSEALAVRGEAQEPTPTDTFSGEHLRLVTNKLADKVRELQAEIEERKQAQDRVQMLNRVYALLSGINSLIVRVLTRDELCRDACRLAVQEGRFTNAWIALQDPERKRVVPVSWAGSDPDLQRITQVAAAGRTDGTDVVSRALASRLPVVRNDLRVSGDGVLDRQRLLAHGYRGLIVLPLVNGATSVGCLVLATDVPDFFDADELRLLSELAGDVAYALDHIEKSEKLDYLAFFDSLTGLANRRLFLERLGQQMVSAQRLASGGALVVMDIERLDSVNESLGRHVGDELLRAAAERLVQCVGNQNDVGRIGSDHLGVMIEGLDGDGDGAAIRAVEDWYREWSSTPFVVAGHEIALSAKFGIASFAGEGADAEAMLRNAEAALKKAKQSAERHAFYTRTLNEARSRWLAMENKLRRAIDNDEFVLHYQPKVDLETRRLKGMEALIRWQSRDLGLVPPAQFIPVLEATGMIADVGIWVMRQSILDRGRWLEQGLPAPRVAVNVSTVQLNRADFVRTTSNMLKLAGADPGLDIEVTESLLMSDVDQNIEKLTAVRALGVRIAIDDFGTGFSSLGYLARLPAEILKIDRSFIATMLEDPSAMTLVSTIISLAHSLKLDVVAEGVESGEQAKILRLLRCEQMQGYLVSKPLPFEEVTAWLGRNR